MNMDFGILTWLILLPLISAGALTLFKRDRVTEIRYFALAASCFVLLIALRMAFTFDPSFSGMQFEKVSTWLPSLGIKYHVGVDGISVFLVLLTAILTPLCVLCSWRQIQSRVKEFFVCLFLLEAGVIGAFLALDLMLFYVFWEAMLIPMYLLIGVWGGESRVYAAVKFFLYTMAGSLLMFVAIIYLYTQTGSFEISAIKQNFRPSLGVEMLLFAAFAISFAIKVPLFPFHTWLPWAHTEAPTAGSVMLAGVLLKMGVYGFMRFAIPLFPNAAAEFTPLIIALSITGVIYGSLMCFAQTDIKKLVAYSSVSHLGMVMLGVFAFTEKGAQGAIIQMLNHGVSTGALFLLVGLIYERTHTRDIADYGGFAKTTPKFAAAFMIVMLSSIGLPLTNGFVGEFLIIIGAFERAPIYAALAVSGVILGAAYMLWLYHRVFFGAPDHESGHVVEDMNKREFVYLLPMVVLIFAIGIYPNLILSRTKKAADKFLAMSRTHSSISVEATSDEGNDW